MITVAWIKYAWHRLWCGFYIGGTSAHAKKRARYHALKRDQWEPVR